MTNKLCMGCYKYHKYGEDCWLFYEGRKVCSDYEKYVDDYTKLEKDILEARK